MRDHPRAEVVAVDWDPWLVELGRRTAFGSRAWVEADLCDQGWVEELPPAQFDVVVATTALHWFGDDHVRRLYRDLAALVVPGAAFLSSDLIDVGGAAVARLARIAQTRWQDSRTSAPPGEHWSSFWRDAEAEPLFAELMAERKRRFGGRFPGRGRPLEFHERALRDAGFSEVGEVWRHHQNAIVLALADAAERAPAAGTG